MTCTKHCWIIVHFTWAYRIKNNSILKKKIIKNELNLSQSSIQSRTVVLFICVIFWFVQEVNMYSSQLYNPEKDEITKEDVKKTKKPIKNMNVTLLFNFEGGAWFFCWLCRSLQIALIPLREITENCSLCYRKHFCHPKFDVDFILRIYFFFNFF